MRLYRGWPILETEHEVAAARELQEKTLYRRQGIYREFCIFEIKTNPKNGVTFIDFVETEFWKYLDEVVEEIKVRTTTPPTPTEEE